MWGEGITRDATITANRLPAVKLTLATCYRSRLDKRTGWKRYEHRAVAKWKLGRPLLPGEVMHVVISPWRLQRCRDLSGEIKVPG